MASVTMKRYGRRENKVNKLRRRKTAAAKFFEEHRQKHPG